MSVQLVILGFLKERDYHGYELKKEIQRRMGQWTDIKFGSIYHALGKLVDSGAVEEVETLRQRKRPDRTVYRITAEGREEFQNRLRFLLNRTQRVYLDFDVGLYFAGNLPPGELNDILDAQLARYEQTIEMLENVKELPVHKSLPKISEVIVDHTLHHLRAEVKWLQETQERLEKEALYE